MNTHATALADAHLPDEQTSAFAREAIDDLSQHPKRLSPKFFYDAAGSELFEAITRLPEYYPTRTELGILRDRGSDIAAIIPEGAALIEFGAGSTTKVRLLLEKCAFAAYVPVDISGDFLRDSAEALAARFPGLAIYPVEADFTQRVDLPREICPLPKLGFFPGSTIGNMVARTAIDLLRGWRATLGDGSLMLIGVDRIKDIGILERAYDDPSGVTAAFNLNLLERINRELGGDIAVENFSHRAVWNDVHARIEMHLVAACDMDITVDGHTYHLAKDQTIHSENSHKYGPRDANLLLRAGGWTPVATWDDVDPAFALILAEATEFRSAP
jgi:dimethylhistidine N-methyltransferase